MSNEISYKSRPFPFGYLRDDGYVYDELCGCDRGEFTIANGQSRTCDCVMLPEEVKEHLKEVNKKKEYKYVPSLWEEYDSMF